MCEQYFSKRLRRKSNHAKFFFAGASEAMNPPGYVLYLQGREASNPRSPCDRRLSNRMQSGLEQNPHYRHAMQLGQLAEAKAIVLDPQGESAWQIFERVCIAKRATNSVTSSRSHCIQEHNGPTALERNHGCAGLSIVMKRRPFQMFANLYPCT